MTPANKVPLVMTVNGQVRQLEVSVHNSLLDVLRDDLNLTGAKEVVARGSAEPVLCW